MKIQCDFFDSNQNPQCTLIGESCVYDGDAEACVHVTPIIIKTAKCFCPMCGEPLKRVHSKEKHGCYRCTNERCDVIEVRVDKEGEMRVLKAPDYPLYL